MKHKLPKVILHEHLEGSVTPSIAKQLAEKHQVVLPDDFFYAEQCVDEQEFPAGRYHYDETDFRQFIRTYDTVANLIREPEDFYLITQDFLFRNAQQGLIYCELIVSPFHLCAKVEQGATVWDEKRYQAILAAIEQAIIQVQTQHDLTVRLQAVAIRHLGTQCMYDTLQFVQQHPHSLISGFNIAGDERVGQFSDYQQVHQLANDLALQTSYHAGEICSAQSVVAAIELGAERIGHGVRAIEDDLVIQQLIEQNITLEVAMTSNRLLLPELRGDIHQHPVRKLYDLGVRLTLNTDDAGIFGTDIGKEYQIAVDIFDFNRIELLDITLCALEAAFVDMQTKQRLIRQVYQQFTQADSKALAQQLTMMADGALKQRLAERYQQVLAVLQATEY